MVGRVGIIVVGLTGASVVGRAVAWGVVIPAMVGRVGIIVVGLTGAIVVGRESIVVGLTETGLAVIIGLMPLMMNCMP